MKYLMTFSYDGSEFNGYQKQKDKRTVQNELEKALSKIYNQQVLISASGRTDALVHALNQCAHFEVNKKIDTKKLTYALNSLLPNDIYIKNIKKVNDSFHARFDVISKEYMYKINMGQYNPLEKKYIFQYNKPLNIDKMKQAIKFFEGTHNFKTFSKTYEEEKDYIRTIYETSIVKKGKVLTIYFKGNGFLRYMVRNMVGTLLEVGKENIEPEYINELLKLMNRKYAFKTANPEGLYLKKVFYK